MPQQRSKWWILFYFCLASGLVSFNVSALTAVIPAIARSLGLSANDASAIIPYYMIPYGIGALVYAPLATRFSIRRLMLIACLSFAAGNALSFFVDNMAVVLTGRVIAGFGASAVTPLGLMTLGKIFEKSVRGRVIGAFFSSSFIGAMMGLLLSGFAPWHWLFAVPMVMAVLLAIGFIFCPREGMEANSHVQINYPEAITVGGLRRILIFIFIMSLFFQGACKWYGVYLDKIYGFNQMTISLLIVFSTLAATFGQMIGGYITDKLGRAQACYVGIVILGISMMMLYGHFSLVGIAVVLACISLGWTITHNGISTVLTDFPDTYRLELAALNSSVRFVSGGLGFWLSGSFMEANFHKTYLCIGIMMLMLLTVVHKIVPLQGKALNINNRKD